MSYRFLTRAPFTVEREEPFGPGIAGLELWNRSSLTDAEVQSIAKFLCAQQHLSAELRTWLQTAAASDIRRELIDRVIWQTHSPDIESSNAAYIGNSQPLLKRGGPFRPREAV